MAAGRITMFTSGLAAGGSELQLAQLAIGLRSRGWIPTVISAQAGGYYRNYLLEHAIGVQECQVGRVATPTAFVRLLGSIIRTRPDLVHTFGFRANLWGRLCAALNGTPVIAAVQATYSYLPVAYFPFERLLAGVSGFITVPSQSVARFLTTPIGISARRIVVMHNGVDSARFSPSRDGAAFRRAWGLGSRFVVLVPARITPQKNHPALLRAFRRFAEAYPEATLLLAGRGPWERMVREQARGLGERVLFTGELSREGMADAMAASDVVFLMSEYEGMPNALIEGMATARPVVSTRVDGVSELIEHRKEGLLIPPRDVAAAADALLQLARAPEERARFGRAGRAKIEREYSIEANVRRHVELYERLLAGVR